MSLEYIRNAYGVPAYKGARVKYMGNSVPMLGTIQRGENGHLVVLMDGEKRPRRFHPVWMMGYVPEVSDD